MNIWHNPTEEEIVEMVRRYDARQKYLRKTYTRETRRVRRDIKRREKERLKREEERLEHERIRLEKRARKAAASEENQRNRLGLVKERRNRIEWRDLIDDKRVAKRQERWERDQTALAMRKAGLTFAEIGSRMGVSYERARQMSEKAKRTRKWSPIEQYQQWSGAGLAVLHGLPRRRKMHMTLDVFAQRNRDWLIVGNRFGTHATA